MNKLFMNLAKSIVVLIAFNACNHANANILLNGLYVGASAGSNILTSQIKQTVNFKLVAGGDTVTNVTVTPNPNAYEKTIMGNILAGYEVMLNNFVSLGLEGRFNFYDINELTRFTLHEQNSNLMIMSKDVLKQYYDFNLLLKPGVNLALNSKIYLVAGLAAGKFSVMNQANYGQVIDFGLGVPVDLTSNVSSTIKKHKNGTVIGLGLQQSLNNRFGIRLEYDHVNFGRIATANIANPISASLPILAPLIAGSILTKYANNYMANDRCMLGIVYTFGNDFKV